MYENNNNGYSQQSNNAGNTNNGYPEYYYSTGIPNVNYEQTQRPPMNTPKVKQKKANSFGKKAVSIVCLGLVFGFLLVQLLAFLHRLPQKN